MMRNEELELTQLLIQNTTMTYQKMLQLKTIYYLTIQSSINMPAFLSLNANYEKNSDTFCAY